MNSVIDAVRRLAGRRARASRAAFLGEYLEACRPARRAAYLRAFFEAGRR